MRICVINITSSNMCWGYRNYLTELIPRIAVHPRVQDLLVAIPDFVDGLPLHAKADSVRWVPLSCGLLPILERRGANALKAIRAFNADVVFFPTARYMHFSGKPVVNMVRNMMPATHSYSLNWIDGFRNKCRLLQMR